MDIRKLIAVVPRELRGTMMARGRSDPEGGQTMARLLSVNVGMPKDVAWRDRTVHTGSLEAARCPGRRWCAG